MYFLGVDGGGTKTLALLTDETGRLLGVGRGGPVNLSWNDEATAETSLRTAVSEACDSAGISLDQIRFACLGLGSVGDHGRELAFFQSVCERMGLGPARCTIENDAWVGMAAAIGLRPGVAVVAGTGFIAVSRGIDGKRYKVPWYVGSRAASWALGRMAALAALFDLLGTGETTAITRGVLRILGLCSSSEARQQDSGRPNADIPYSARRNEADRREAVRQEAAQLESWISVSRNSKEWGQLAPAVSHAAQLGDRLAMQMLETAGHELGLSAVMVARQAGLDRLGHAVPVATVGSLFSVGEPITAPMREVIAASGFDALFVPTRTAPAGGAVYIAWQLAGLSGADASFDTLVQEIADSGIVSAGTAHASSQSPLGETEAR